MKANLGLSKQTSKAELIDLKLIKGVRIPIKGNLRGSHLIKEDNFDFVSYRVLKDKKNFGAIEINYYNEGREEGLKTTKRFTQLSKAEAKQFIIDYYETQRYESLFGID